MFSYLVLFIFLMCINLGSSEVSTELSPTFGDCSNDDDDDISIGKTYLLEFRPELDGFHRQELRAEGSFHNDLDLLFEDYAIPANGSLNVDLRFHTHARLSDQDDDPLKAKDQVLLQMKLETMKIATVLDSQLRMKWNSQNPAESYPEDAHHEYLQIFDSLFKVFGPVPRLRSGRSQYCSHIFQQTSVEGVHPEDDICLTPLLGNLYYSDHRVSLGDTWTEYFDYDENPEFTVSGYQTFELDNVWFSTDPHNQNSRNTCEEPRIRELANITGHSMILLTPKGIFLPAPDGDAAKLTLEIMSTFTVDVRSGVPLSWIMTIEGNMPMMPAMNISTRLKIESKLMTPLSG